MTHAELAERVRAAAYLEGDFTLRSGRKSQFYLDKYLFETQPDILAALGQTFATFRTARTTLFAGAELGGVALAAAASIAGGLPFVIIRNAKKDYGTQKMFEGALKPGDVVLLVEDIATTGGQVLDAAGVIRVMGAEVETIVAVVDRGEGARENIERAGYSFRSILSAADLRLPSAG